MIILFNCDYKFLTNEKAVKNEFIVNRILIEEEVSTDGYLFEKYLYRTELRTSFIFN